MGMIDRVAGSVTATLSAWLSLLKEERAQGAVEYLLVTGAIAVTIAGALIVGFETLVPLFRDLVINIVDPCSSGC